MFLILKLKQISIKQNLVYHKWKIAILSKNNFTLYNISLLNVHLEFRYLGIHLMHKKLFNIKGRITGFEPVTFRTTT